MATRNKRNFLLRWVKTRLVKAGTYDAFKQRWRLLYGSYHDRWPDDTLRRWGTFALVAGEYPAAEYDGGLESWKTHVANYQANFARGRLTSASGDILAGLDDSEIVDIAFAAQAEQKKMEGEAKAARKERTRLKALELKEKESETRRIHAEARLAEANKPRAAPAPRADEEAGEMLVPLAHVPVLIDLHADVLRDASWVYCNLNDLIIEDLPGVRHLNLIALARAPGSGAVSMANYALADFKAFFKTFVMRLLPKDIEMPTEVTQEEKEAEMDPDLSIFERFFEKETQDAES